MLYLLIAVLCGSLFSIIFKVSQRLHIDSAQVILFNYLFAAIVSWAPLLYGSVAHGSSEAINPFAESWLGWALLQGVFFMGGFLVMDISTFRSGVALTTASARASLILSVVFCWLFLQQPAPSWGSVALVVVAMLLMILPNEQQPHPAGYAARSKDDRARRRKARMMLAFVFLFYGVSDFMLKVSQHAVETLYVTDGAVMDRQLSALTATIFTSATLLALAYCSVKGLFRTGVTWKGIGMGLLLGAANIGCTTCMLRALTLLPTGIFYPLYNIGIVTVATLAGVLVFREKLRSLQIVGLVTAAVAIFLFFR